VAFCGINVCGNTVFRLQFVTIPPSRFHNMAASALHNQIWRPLSIIKSLAVFVCVCVPQFFFRCQPDEKCSQLKDSAVYRNVLSASVILLHV